MWSTYGVIQYLTGFSFYEALVLVEQREHQDIQVGLLSGPEARPLSTVHHVD